MADSSRLQQRTEFIVEPKRASACVVVFHEVWGLVDHTEDVCKRVGKLGFAAIAPNLYREYGDILTPTKIQKAMEGLWELSLEERRDKEKVARALNKKGTEGEVREVAAMIYDPAFRGRMLEDAVAVVERAHSRFGSVSTLGFCMGGGLSLRCATRSRHMKSAVSFYGQPPAANEVQRISIPILDIHANHDEIINEAVPAWVGEMLEGGKDLTLKTYPQTEHGFFNDTRKEVYDRSASKEAWDITRWFLERTL